MDSHDVVVAAERSLDEAVRRADILRHVIEAISSGLALEPVLTRVLSGAVELIEAHCGTVGLVVHHDSQSLVRTLAVHNMPEGELGSEVASGVGLGGCVLLEQRPLHFDRYGAVPSATLPELAEHVVIGMPIQWAGRMIGFIGIGAEPPRRFSDGDIDTLAGFARYAAIAIHNAQIFEAEQRRAARIAIINRIDRLIGSSLSLDEILQTAIESIREYMQHPSVALLLVDVDNPDTLVLRARGGVYTDNVVGEYRQTITQGIVGAAACTRVSVLVNDVRRDPRYIPIPGAADIIAELAVPMLIGDRLLGVLNVESERRIEEEDATGLATIADQMAVAINNAYLFAGAQRALHEMSLLYETSQRISTALNIDEVIQAYLEQVATRGLYVCSIVLYEYDDADQRVAVVLRGHWSPQVGLRIFEQRIPYTRDALDPPLDAGQTITISDVFTDTRVTDDLRELQRRDQRPALALIPLMVRGKRIGLVVLSYPAIYHWSEEDLRPYQATAAQLATAIDSRRQQRLLYERGQQIAVLEERQRLARDLHDSITQLLFSITLVAQSIEPAWQRGTDEGRRRIERLLHLSQMALAEMRALLNELRPQDASAPSVADHDTPILPDLMRLRRDGLVAAIRQHAAHIAHDELHIDIEAGTYADVHPRPSFGHEEALYRIAQEALNNVVKHAQAHHVLIELSATDDVLQVAVRDSGAGFAVDETDQDRPQRGFGLKTMRERVEALGGRLEIDSVRGDGTTIQAIFPRRAKT